MENKQNNDSCMDEIPKHDLNTNISFHIEKIEKTTNEENNETKNKKEPCIKHMVISGGGSAGLSYLGILKKTFEIGLWNYSHLKTIYATSVGSICAFVVALKIEFDILVNYFVNRPWEKLFHMNGNFLQYFCNKGILGKNVIEELFQPLFKYKDFDMNMTMLELYNITGIEIHSFCTNLDDFSLVNMSHKTHPQWKIMDVIYCSCCLPILFEPCKIENNMFVDGGLLCNYPLKQCIEEQNPEILDEIMGMDMYMPPVFLKEGANLFEYIMHLLRLFIDKLRTIEENRKTLANEIIVYECPEVYEIINVMSDINKRRNIIDIGYKTVENKYKFL